MSGEPLYFEDLEPGRECTSAARTITAQDVFAFAELTGDRNPVHLDPDFARATPFRRCIAHGLFGLALIGGMTTDAPPTRRIALLEVREWHFRAPIYIGDSIRVRTCVLQRELQGRGRRGLVVSQVQIINQDNRVVQEGVTATLIETRAAGRLGSSAEAA
jgi:acyl dehydratase